MKILIEVEVPNSDEINGITAIQDMVELFYPNYYSADEIAWENDLQKLVDRQWEDGDSSDDLLHDAYGGNIDNPQIIIDHQAANVDMYERTLHSFINNIKSIKQI